MPKTTEFSWADSPESRTAAMAEAHQARHRAGREANVQRRAESVTRSQDKADERRNHATWKKRRRAEDRELAALAYRRFRVEVPVENRSKRPSSVPRKSLNREVHGIGSTGPSRPEGELREVYMQWSGRGFGSGREWKSGRKTFGQPRPARWRAGETKTKIVYITRGDALVDVPGALLSNIGTTVDELGACFLAIEELEQLGRANANVYYHAIASVDASLSPTAQAAVLAGIVMPLQDAGLGYVAALHRPDPDGDQRNVHIHVILTLRPVTRVAPYEWNFGVSKLASIDTPEGLRSIRHHIAKTMNAELAAAGRAPRWTARSRAERGLLSPGNTKRGPIATARERSALARLREKQRIEAKAAKEKLRRGLKAAAARLASVLTELADHHRDLARARSAAVARIRVTISWARAISRDLIILQSHVAELRERERRAFDAAEERKLADATAARELKSRSEAEAARVRAEEIRLEILVAKREATSTTTPWPGHVEASQIAAAHASVTVVNRDAPDPAAKDTMLPATQEIGESKIPPPATEDDIVAARSATEAEEAAARRAREVAETRASIQLARETAEAIRAKNIQNAQPAAAEAATIAAADRVRASTETAIPVPSILVGVDRQSGLTSAPAVAKPRKLYHFTTLDPVPRQHVSSGEDNPLVTSSPGASDLVARLPALTPAPLTLPATGTFAGGIADAARLRALLISGRRVKQPSGTTLDNVATIGIVKPHPAATAATNKLRRVAPTVDGPAPPPFMPERGRGR